VHLGEAGGRSLLTVPDFRGNASFNTLGNVAVNPATGVLFVDFATGDLLMLSGRAEVVWDGPDLARFAGAQRLLRFHAHEGVRIESALPLRWSPPEPAPQLAETGSWDAGAQRAF